MLLTRSLLVAEPVTRFSASGMQSLQRFHAPADIDPDTSGTTGTADSVPAADGADETQAADAAFDAEIKAMIDAQVQSTVVPLTTEIADLKKQLAEAQAAKPTQTNALNAKHLALQRISKLYGSGAPAIRKGEDSMSSRGYEMQRCLGFGLGRPGFDAEHCKQELDMSRWLKTRMTSMGFRQAGSDAIRETILVPLSQDYLPEELQKDFSQKFCGNDGSSLAALFRQSVAGVDPEQLMRAIMGDAQRQNVSQSDIATLQQTLGTLTTASGGLYTDPAWSGEILPLLLSLGNIYKLGAEVGSLPAYGTDRLGREDSIPTAYMVGEGQQITESEGSLGDINFKAKKMAALVRWNNELSRFGGPSNEARVRVGIAMAMALKEDDNCFYGVAETSTNWCGALNLSGLNDLTTNASVSVQGTNGNTFKPEAATMVPAILSDATNIDMSMGRPGWFLRNTMWANMTNKRADAVTAGDKAGNFLFRFTQSEIMGKLVERFGNNPVVASSICRATDVKGSGTTLTHAMFGRWDYLKVRRIGVMELALQVEGDQTFVYDQTRIRAIQHLDAKWTRENALAIIRYLDQTL